MPDTTPSSVSVCTVAPDRPYTLSPRVGLRPEAFGAMAYHFDTRRLVFLKSRDLLSVVESLAAHDTLDDALRPVVGDDPTRRRRYLDALASLAEAEVICEREDP